MAATITTKGPYTIADGTANDVLDYIASLDYTPQIVGYMRNYSGEDQTSVLWINPRPGN